jgi:hypothetical protein
MGSSSIANGQEKNYRHEGNYDALMGDFVPQSLLLGVFMWSTWHSDMSFFNTPTFQSGAGIAQSV